jgi:hypothetical protein
VAFPQPVPGLVIRYAYLWRADFLKGQEEGVNDRPCAVILVTHTSEGEPIVTVLPVTHSPPRDPALAIEIPAETKRRLRLDAERSWIMLDEANQFAWPGPDLRPANPGEAESVVYGLLPRAFYLKMRERFMSVLMRSGAGVVGRSE